METRAPMTTDEALSILLGEHAEDEMRCESGHNYEKVCSVEVTHLIMGCRGPVRVCERQARDTERRLQRLRKCARCGRWNGDCWSVRPI